MQAVSDNQNQLKPSHVVAGLALSAVPVISYPGDFISDFAAIKKAEKMPFKDVFIKTIENHGERTQKFLKFLDKYPAKKVGTGLAIVGTIFDVTFNIWIMKKLFNWIERRKSK